jgi:hypothetical protein
LKNGLERRWHQSIFWLGTKSGQGWERIWLSVFRLTKYAYEA